MSLMHSVFITGPQQKASPLWDEGTGTGQAEDSDGPEEKGGDRFTDDREDGDAHSPCFSREDSVDTGELKWTYSPLCQHFGITNASSRVFQNWRGEGRLQ